MAQKLIAQDELHLTKGAGEALTAFRFVKLNASNSSNVDLCDTAGEAVLGVVGGAYSSGDAAVPVCYSGITYVYAGGTIAAGDYVATNAAGAAVKASGLNAPDFIAGRALNAAVSGDLVSIELLNAGGFISAIGAGHKFLVIPVTVVAAATEQDTGYNLPAKSIVKGVYLDVQTAEATGGTKTVDVGTDGSGSNDPDGWLDGASVAATGIVAGSLTSGAQTLGALLHEDEDGAGALVPMPDVASSGESITYTLGSNDFAELVANIVIEFVEVQ